MNRAEKAAVIDQVAGEIDAAQAIFAIDYRGITVAQVAELRAKLRDSSTKLRVVKNSLTERAADQAGAPLLKPLLVGPTALAFVKGDAAQAAKALNDANRTLRILEFKGGVMNGTSLSAADVQSIARLPAREVLNAQLTATIAAPLTGLVRTLNALIGGLAIQLGAVAEQGLIGAGATESEPPPSTAEAHPQATPAASESEQTDGASDDGPAEQTEGASDDGPADQTEGASDDGPADQTEGASDDGPSDES